MALLWMAHRWTRRCRSRVRLVRVVTVATAITAIAGRMRTATGTAAIAAAAADKVTEFSPVTALMLVMTLAAVAVMS